MADWQAGLLVSVHGVLQHMHVVLPANTAANNLQTGHQHVQITAPDRQSAWLASKQAMPMLVQSVLQHMHVVFKTYNS